MPRPKIEFTLAERQKIRFLYLHTGMSVAAIGRKFSVSPGVINRVLADRTVTPDPGNTFFFEIVCGGEPVAQGGPYEGPFAFYEAHHEAYRALCCRFDPSQLSGPKEERPSIKITSTTP